MFMHVAITTGMSIEDVRDQFDIPRLEAFNSYTEKFPPQHILIAAYFGFPKDKPKPATENDIAAMIGNFSEVPR
jgi:hypothetical protein